MPAMAVDHQVYDGSVVDVQSDDDFDVGRTKRDVIDLTVWKLHCLNRPTGRDSSLRKSVLIFNLLRCLQTGNDSNAAYLDVDMVSDVANDSRNLSEEETVEERNNDYSLDAETRSAVVSLTMMDQNDSVDNDNSPIDSRTIRILSTTTIDWNSISERTTMPELMDIDQVNYTTLGEDECGQVQDDTPMITQSYRVLGNGEYVLTNQNQHSVDCADSFDDSGTGNFSGDYHPFSLANGFNVFA